MIKTLLLIPIRDNQGRLFPRTIWQQLEDRLLLFGGLSRTRSVTGVWRSDGRIYRDINIQYVVSLRSWLQLPDWIEVVLWAREQFRQEAIYVEVAGIPEVVGREGL